MRMDSSSLRAQCQEVSDGGVAPLTGRERSPSLPSAAVEKATVCQASPLLVPSSSAEQKPLEDGQEDSPLLVSPFMVASPMPDLLRALHEEEERKERFFGSEGETDDSTEEFHEPLQEVLFRDGEDDPGTRTRLVVDTHYSAPAHSSAATEDTEFDDDDVRRRTQSEPEVRIGDLTASGCRRRRRRGRRGGSVRRRALTGAEEEEAHRPAPSSYSLGQLSSTAAAALFSRWQTSPSDANDLTVEPAGNTNGNIPVIDDMQDDDSPLVTPNIEEGAIAGRENQPVNGTANGSTNNPAVTPGDEDPERLARIRWIQINRRFQFVITVVALLFSFLLVGILICWVCLTSAYVISFDKSCDVPLKPYFWLVTLQLVLDVFRSDIMRFVFQWEANSNERIPFRVMAYNVAYLIYALLVIRLGIRSVFLTDDTTCDDTAPELFKASLAFVSLSIAAWATIFCGYLLPFFVVAAMLTYNGYPAAYTMSGAPPGCVDLLTVISIEDFPADYPRECCICMESFDATDVVVETKCCHVFHKSCCREWLRQARTCPVCRDDIVSTLEEVSHDDELHRPPSSIPLGPTGRPVRGLLQILSRTTSDGGSSFFNPSNTPETSRRRPGSMGMLEEGCL